MFPAGAGMNRSYKTVLMVASNVPRRRGDEPGEVLIDDGQLLCSPQARG